MSTDNQHQTNGGAVVDNPSTGATQLPGDPPCLLHRVAITGGPCAGKTTALAEIGERLRSRGFGVYIVPEAATIMFTGGVSLDKATDEHIINFQTQIFHTQMTLEDSFSNLARTSKQKQTFVLCDRGTCDGRAYMDPKLWSTMLKRNHWNMVDIRDARYDLVIHLVTAADGAQEYYTLDNNKARSESPELARAVDKKLQDAWVGHPHLRIVDNRSGFRQKINRVDSYISQLAGLHLSRRIVRKFLLTSTVEKEEKENDINKLICDNSDAAINMEQFYVEQTFLSTGLGDDIQESVRRRGKNEVFTYVHKIRREEAETKRQITLREYTSLLAHKDQSRISVKINRKCFLFNSTYFVLDCVTNINPKIHLLRCHSDCRDEKVVIPTGLTIEKEVTGEKFYSMHSIATRVFSLFC